VLFEVIIWSMLGGFALAAGVRHKDTTLIVGGLALWLLPSLIR